MTANLIVESMNREETFSIDTNDRNASLSLTVTVCNRYASLGPSGSSPVVVLVTQRGGDTSALSATAFCTILYAFSTL